MTTHERRFATTRRTSMTADVKPTSTVTTTTGHQWKGEPVPFQNTEFDAPAAGTFEGLYRMLIEVAA